MAAKSQFGLVVSILLTISVTVRAEEPANVIINAWKNIQDSKGKTLLIEWTQNVHFTGNLPESALKMYRYLDEQERHATSSNSIAKRPINRNPCDYTNHFRFMIRDGDWRLEKRGYREDGRSAERKIPHELTCTSIKGVITTIYRDVGAEWSQANITDMVNAKVDVQMALGAYNLALLTENRFASSDVLALDGLEPIKNATDDNSSVFRAKQTYHQSRMQCVFQFAKDRNYAISSVNVTANGKACDSYSATFAKGGANSYFPREWRLLQYVDGVLIRSSISKLDRIDNFDVNSIPVPIVPVGTDTYQHLNGQMSNGIADGRGNILSTNRIDAIGDRVQYVELHRAHRVVRQIAYVCISISAILFLIFINLRWRRASKTEDSIQK